jgi:hypothetical protein
MKLDFDTTIIERSEDFEEQTFGFSDVTIVMEILRSKLYSNPIKVLVQEYMSNARDAHREIDNNQPIEVQLPSHISPQFEVRDFGPGITPKRMSNVFIKYAASTKRDSNKMTGGWGLGSKSGWSYSDTFSVISITNETGENIKRTYSCIIDETRNGKLVKMCDDAKTEEPCGTRIIVPARKENFNQFRDYAVQTGTLWEVKPIIFGQTINNPSIISEGANWKYFERHTVPTDFISNKAFVVYDGIPYPLKTETLKNLISDEVMAVLNSSCFGLYFNIGDITISANREEIQYTEKTKNTLATRVNEMVSEIASKFSDTIQQEPTFIDALMKFNDISKENDVIAKLISNSVEWNGTKLHRINQLNTMDKAVKIENFYYDDGKLCHIRNAYVHLENKDKFKKIYINDEKLRGAPISKMRGLFYSSSKSDQESFDVYVISYQTNNPKGLSQQEIDNANVSINKWNKENFIGLMDLQTTSSIKKSIIPKGISQPKVIGKLVTYRELKLNVGSDYAVTIEHEDIDSTLSGYYTLIHEGRFSIGGSRYNIRDSWEMRNLHRRLKLVLSHLKVDKILLFTQKYTKNISENKNLIHLPIDISKDIVNSFDSNKIKEYTKYVRGDKMYNHEFFKLLSPMKHMDRFNVGSKIREKLESMLHNEKYIATQEYKEMNSLYEEFNHVIKDLYKVDGDSTQDEDSFSKKYPLLSDRYYGYHTSSNETFVEHAINYINFVDNGKN